MRRREPFGEIVAIMQDKRNEAIGALASGQWDGEADGKRLVGRITVLDELIEEARAIAGPGTQFGEKDL